ncbi:MAG: caspase family protein [Planctomycetes bacterium]|nr:caspase family protein [Planctomycetota bacterium]
MSRNLLLMVALLLMCLQTRSGLSQDSSVAKPRQWALLIAAEDYAKAPKLQFTVNDVRRLRETLTKRGGMLESHILSLTDDGEKLADRPVKASIEAMLPAFLKKPGPQDSVVVYFSGHGFRDKDGKLYLAPLDIDPANAAATGVPIEWFRGLLDECPAAFKLLILDACHAGSEKGEDGPPSASAKDIGDSFKGAKGVVTIASSTAEEKSRIWEFKQQSLFSYWLNEGLKGHSDVNGDGEVNVDELYDYVYSRVGQTANVRFNSPQTPVRIIGSRVPGVPVVVKLIPQPLKQVLGDMAEQLSAAMEENQLNKVGVLEFTSLTPEGEVLGANFGSLGRYCGDELKQRLMDRSAGKFSVLDRVKMEKSLVAVNFKTKDLQSESSLRNLGKSAGNVTAIAAGMLQGRSGRIVTLRCSLKGVLGEKALGEVGGVALISESEWAQTGHSAEVKPEDRRPEIGAGNQLVRPVEEQVIDRLDARANEPHPMQNPNFPFRISINVNNEPRKPLLIGNDCYVMLRKGEKYEIWIENRSKQTVAMRLLVDGLNTLPEKEDDAKGIATYVIGKPVSLNEARHWVLDPEAPGALFNGIPTFTVRGFASETGEQGKTKRFTITDAEQSLAARQKYTDNIGLISAAFYTPGAGGKSRGAVGTAAGEEVQENLKERDDVSVGNLIASLHIRYVDEETFRTIQP